ncbi:mCG1031049, isoform CRA_d [Mus musculus]|nr:mCG1031049, isoform CRA_d [Mus musculus]
MVRNLPIPSPQPLTSGLNPNSVRDLVFTRSRDPLAWVLPPQRSPQALSPTIQLCILTWWVKNPYQNTADNVNPDAQVTAQKLDKLNQYLIVL